MIILDCEIVRCIPSADGSKTEGLDYCQGWHDFIGMGLSVCVAYDYWTAQYRVFCQDNLANLQDLIDRSSTVVGFHSVKFDGPLLAANGINIPTHKHYDLRQETLIAAGKNPDAPHNENRGYSLHSLCVANGLPGKTITGELAPVMWQRGQYGRVIDYCISDVHKTVSLFQKLFDTGMYTLIDPVTTQVLSLRSPV